MKVLLVLNVLFFVLFFTTTGILYAFQDKWVLTAIWWLGALCWLGYFIMNYKTWKMRGY